MKKPHSDTFEARFKRFNAMPKTVLAALVATYWSMIPCNEEAFEQVSNAYNLYRDEQKEKAKARRDAALTDASPEVIRLPLANGGEAMIRQSLVDAWRDRYPGVNVPNELRRMRNWLLDNPRRRKTIRGIARFVGNWLDTEQNRARPPKFLNHEADRGERAERLLARIEHGGADARRDR